MVEETIAAGFIQGMVNYALSLDVSQRHLFEDIEVSMTDLTVQDSRLPLSTASKLWNNATSLSNDPAFSVHFGESSACSDMSIIGMIGESSPTFGDALLQILRFSNLGIYRADKVNKGLRLDVKKGLAKLSSKNDNSDFSKMLIETSFSRMVAGINRTVVGKVKLSQVCFQHAKPNYVSEYERIFEAPILFSQKENSLSFAEEFLQSPMLNPKPYLHRILTEHALNLLKKTKTAMTTTDRVRRYIYEQLHIGRISVQRCAETLAISRQTLYRKLQQENTSYKEVLDATRHALALEYLAQKNKSIIEISFLLGFSESSTFNRAFKRWVGKTPGQIKNDIKSQANSSRKLAID